jgi:hypothetical protein
MMNLTTTQPIQGQLPSSIKNVNSSNSLHLNSNYPLGLMPLATQIAGHGSEGMKKIYRFSRMIIYLGTTRIIT